MPLVWFFNLIFMELSIMNTNFQKIDIDAWERKDEYEFFVSNGCGFTLTSDIDITRLYQFSHDTGEKLYPLLVATVMQVLNAHREFRYGWSADDSFVCYDVMHPLIFDKMTSDNVKALVVEYKPDTLEQVKEIAAVREKYKNVDKYHPQESLVPNMINISAVPWVKTTGVSFCLQHCATYFTPILTFGQLEKKDGKAAIPLTVYANHAVNDGYHVARLFMEYQELVGKL